MFILETFFGRVGTTYLFKTKSQTIQTMCHENVYKTCLKLDFRPILYAYNLLGYGETLSGKIRKSQTNQKCLKMLICCFMKIEVFQIIQTSFLKFKNRDNLIN